METILSNKETTTLIPIFDLRPYTMYTYLTCIMLHVYYMYMYITRTCIAYNKVVIKGLLKASLFWPHDRHSHSHVLCFYTCTCTCEPSIKYNVNVFIIHCAVVGVCNVTH